MLKLQEIPEGDMELITVKDLRADRALFPMTFAELKSRNFPVSAFEAAKICPRSVWPMPGGQASPLAGATQLYTRRCDHGVESFPPVWRQRDILYLESSMGRRVQTSPG